MVLAASSESFASDAWSCTYPGFSVNRKPVTVIFGVQADKLVDLSGVSTYDIIENNEVGLIAVDHYSQFDGGKGAVRIFSSTVIIDKTFGHFIYTVAEIGEEPDYAKGICSKELGTSDVHSQ